MSSIAQDEGAAWGRGIVSRARFGGPGLRRPRSDPCQSSGPRWIEFRNGSLQSLLGMWPDCSPTGTLSPSAPGRSLSLPSPSASSTASTPRTPARGAGSMRPARSAMTPSPCRSGPPPSTRGRRIGIPAVPEHAASRTSRGTAAEPTSQKLTMTRGALGPCTGRCNVASRRWTRRKSLRPQSVGYRDGSFATAHKLVRVIHAVLHDRPYTDPGIDDERLVVERHAPRWIRSSAPSRRTRGRRIATFRPPSTPLGAIDDCIVGDVVEPHPAHRPPLGPPRPRKSLRPRESHPRVIPDYPDLSRIKTLGHAARNTGSQSVVRHQLPVQLDNGLNGTKVDGRPLCPTAHTLTRFIRRGDHRHGELDNT